MTLIPDTITHLYDPAHGVGKNICNLSKCRAEQVLEAIRASGTRKIKADYFERRLATEDWLIAERNTKLGETALSRPIYFFLGNFADGKDPSRPASLVMPLSAFACDMLTFTYPDSMASLPIATRDCHRSQRKPYHGQVFALPEIREVISKYGLPGERWKTDPTMKYDKFIEVQVWDDKPICLFLARTSLS